MRLRRALLLEAALISMLLLGSCTSRSLPGAGGDGQPLPDSDVPGGDAACPARYSVQPPVAFNCGPDHYPGSTLEATGGWIYYTARETLGSNASSDSDLFARHPASGQLKQLTMDDLETDLIAAADGDVLYGSHASSPMSSELFFRTKSQVVALGSDVKYMFGIGSMYAARSPRLISQGSVVWRGAQTIYRYDGVSSRALATLPTSYYAELDHQAGSVVWSTSDGKDTELFLYRNATVTQLTRDDSDDRKPQLSGAAVFWICGESVCRWEAGNTQQLDKGKCIDLIVNQGMAAWVCDGQVMLYDGKAARPVVGNRGDKMRREGLRLDGGRLLWLEVEGGQDEYRAQGKIYFSDGHHTQLVSPVGLPCVVCDAYWPPLALSLSGDVAAWSYHLDGGPPKWNAGSCAYSTITKQACH